jgi:predicted ester cyclase
MTDPRTLAEQLFTIIDSHRYADAGTVLHPDAQVSTPLGGAMSVDAWLDVNRSFAAAFPDGRHTLTEIVVDGDRVAVEGAWSGTHTGPMAGPGGEIPPTGRSAVLPFCTVATVRGDRIAAVAVYFDQMSMLGQLGLVPEPASAS